MEQIAPEQRRQYFRLRYPHKDRPVITLMGRTFHVCEISERGMRIIFVSSTEVALGITVSGKIEFFDKETIEVEGTILRQHDAEVALKLSKGISLKRMTIEQRRLRKKYPAIYCKRTA
jgi:hypothetical protein